MAPSTCAKRRALRVEAEADAVALALEPMHADGETMPIDLIAMQQARLDDPFAATDLIEQPMDIGDQILVDVGQMRGDHRAEQQPAETRRRIDRQHEMAERQRDGSA